MYDDDDDTVEEQPTHFEKAVQFHDYAQDFGGGDLTDTIRVDLEAEFTEWRNFTINPLEAYVMFAALHEYHARKHRRLLQ